MSGLNEELECNQPTYGDQMLKAAAFIDAHGWRKRSMGGPDAGPVCAWGAVYYSAEGHKPGVTGIDRAYDTRRKIESLLPERQGWPHPSLVAWNDRPGTNKADVVRLLDLAAWMFDDQPIEPVR